MGNLKPPLEKINKLESASPDSTSRLWQMVLRRLLQQPSSQIGLFLFGALILMAVFAEQIAPYDPAEILVGVEDVALRAAPCIHVLGCPESQPQHIMGTDSQSRDFFSRVIYGTRISLFIGLSTVSLAMLLGMILGAAAGYSGGWWDFCIMRVMDVMLAFPVLLLALVVVALLGPGLPNIFIAITIVQIPHYARITRAGVLSLKETVFVEASRALGGGYFHILLNRILPNTLPPLIVYGMLGGASAILEAAALSFLGFGPNHHTPEWGAMLGHERNSMFSTPHLVLFPGIAIMVTALAFNLLGEGLREAFNPRQTDSKKGTQAAK